MGRMYFPDDFSQKDDNKEIKEFIGCLIEIILGIAIGIIVGIFLYE